MELEGLDEAAARRRQQAADRARSLYVRSSYDRDDRDVSLYHLVIDSVAVPLDACVELITRTAVAIAAAGAAEPPANQPS